MEKRERAHNYAQIWYKSRTDAGFSQEAMAMEMGVSKKTIQNWERGLTFPDMFQGEEWFRILNLNPMKYYLAYHHPVFFPEVSDHDNTSNVLHQYLMQASEEHRAKLLWLIEGRRDNVWNSMLELMMMHSLLSFESRAVTAQMVLDMYEIECPHGPGLSAELTPDTDNLRAAIEKAKAAAKKKRK